MKRDTTNMLTLSFGLMSCPENFALTIIYKNVHILPGLVSMYFLI